MHKHIPAEDDLLSTELLLDRYELVRQIGQGSQGRTFLGIDIHDDSQVAVKELDLRQAQDWKTIELFEREAQVLQSLDHPAIPNYVDSFHLSDPDTDEERFFLVQEFVDAISLQERLDSGQIMGPDEASHFLHTMLDILDYLHGLSPPVIHRDIKPSNILVRPDQSYALIDFGTVQLLNPDMIDDATIAGSTDYMPPEQRTGRATPATDLFALAATTVHLITGMAPSILPLSRMKLQYRDLVPFQSPLLDVLDQMLEPDVDERPATTRAVFALLSPEKSLSTPTPDLPTHTNEAPPQGELQAPVYKPIARIRRQDDTLLVHTCLKSTLHINPGVITALLGFFLIGLSCMGAPFFFQGIAILFVGTPVVILVCKLIGTDQEELLRLSPAGIDVFKGSKLLSRPLSYPFLHIPLDQFDHARPHLGRLAMLSDYSSPHSSTNLSPPPGLLLVDKNNATHSFGTAIITRGKATFSDKPNTLELEWVSAQVDQHIRHLKSK